ncbi:MAG TPA: enoyl-CoA hydratase/isomerase family protein [Thermoanaerobaculia bacterium]|nr:enoyl-CoA hydratase/isomerase family protein [Thermoanaerobaculia bacterium]
MIERTDRDGVAVLRLAHGKASALDLELLGEMRRHLAALADSDVAALVLTGTGGIFSAGVDLFRMVNEGEPYVRRFFPAMVDAFSDLFMFPRPVIAAVNGHAIAGGAIVVAACDYRIMATGKGRFAIPELMVGVPFPALALEIVRFGSPSQHVEDLVYTGTSLTPAEALERGLIQEIAGPDGLLDRAVAVAAEIGSKPRDAFRLTKRQLRAPFAARAREFAAADQEALAIWSSAATHQHIRAYLERTLGK